ncbi:MAG: signal recognition particle-docking protein FtsY [Desulfoplanes sp.]|nr:signal recognition particle-docking protein FtsY [Desulfoplanes sp.]
MGFFSKIKKIWNKEETAQQPLPSKAEKAPETELEQPPVTAIPAPLEIVSAEPAPRTEQPIQKPEKLSLFRKLLGTQKEPPAPSIEQPSVPDQEKPASTVPLPDTYTQEKPRAVQRPVWQTDLLHALEHAEPKLSIWLEHLLTGISRRGDVLWERLYFLLEQLEVPKAEAEDFVRRFELWLEDMDYERVEEFRSELQYRLALALDLEDEEDEQSRLFLKLSNGLNKTREQLSKRIDQLLSITGSYDEAFWEELEEILIMADVGYEASHKLLERLKPKVKQGEIADAQTFKDLLRDELVEIFNETACPPRTGTPEVVLMVGVNGVGKTTTIAKLAHRAQMQGKKVMMAAGDTFRAAAIEQLSIWSKRVGAGFYAKEHGADPAAVAYEAMSMALSDGYDQIFIDTAGRIQTKVDLMEELKKIKRVLGKKMAGAPHRTILVLDATTGQNALSQVKLFSQTVDLDEIVLTKLDGTAKGGIIVAVALEYKIPISFIGLGEQMEDLRPFNGEDFAKALLG